MRSKFERVIHIFDCDGVILDSNFLKLRALRSALADVGSHESLIDWAEEDFRLNFGRTRAQHFESFGAHASANNYSLTSERLVEAKDKYSEIVLDLYQKCDVIDKTRDYISKIPWDHLVYIVSASEQDELRHIIPAKLDLISPSNIFGGPISKADNIRCILQNYENYSAFLYGDAVQDAKAAIENNVKFFGLTEFYAEQEELINFCDENCLECFSNCLEVAI